MKLKHFFLPHPETHKKAHLITSQAFLVYIAIFIVLQFSFNFVARVRPEVLSAAANVDSNEVIRLTNVERAKKGLPELKYNPALEVAAQKKGENMLAENYWAHFSPSGKSPWDFIIGSGYRYTYAGENLARNFTDSTAVVEAWMNSPTHRDNIVNSNYQDIGIAVLQGELLGQQTVLVVQEFGRQMPVNLAQANTPAVEATPQATAVATPTPTIAASVAPSQIPTQEPTSSPVIIAAETPVPSPSSLATPATTARPVVAGQKESAQMVLVNPFIWTRTLGYAAIALIVLLIVLDIYIMRRRAVVRLSSRHLPHLAMLGVAASTLANMGMGQVL